MNKKNGKQDMNIMKLMEKYSDDDACREALAGLRWPDGITCPRCESKDIRNSYTRDQYDCGSCEYQFSVTANTIFHDSHLPLTKWFLGIYLICSAKQGVSAKQLQRQLSVSYKTAWYMAHRIRLAMSEDDDFCQKFAGVCEVDETYIGGK